MKDINWVINLIYEYITPRRYLHSTLQDEV